MSFDDVEQKLSLQLLLECQKLNDLFKEFTTRDFEVLLEYVSVLRFKKGEQVVKAGEDATFMGIILDGERTQGGKHITHRKQKLTKKK